MNSELKTYPEQAPYVKGRKIWLELENDQKIVISVNSEEGRKWKVKCRLRGNKG